MPHDLPATASSLKFTVVVDNVIDIFLPGDGPMAYPRPGKCSSLLAEQGLSLWLEVADASGNITRVLYDFGRGQAVMPHNMEILGLSARQADVLVLSHGHVDHYGCLRDILADPGVIAGFVAHPAVFGPRGVLRPDGGLAGPWSLDETDIGRMAGHRMRLSQDPIQLGPGLFFSGSIARRSKEDKPLKAAVRIEGGEPVPDAIEDDSALMVCLGSKGVVVITGCCHSGLINTMDAAARLFPGEPLAAIIGGFHLNNLKGHELDLVIKAMEQREPGLIVPMHCTGSRAQHKLRQAFGPRFLFSTVGAVLNL